MTVLPGPVDGTRRRRGVVASRRGRARARRRRRADRRDGRLRLPRAAGARPARRRPDDPADPAALPRARAASTAGATYDEVGRAGQRGATAGPSPRDNIRTLVDQQLRPLGLLAKADGSQPEVQEVQPAARRCGSSTPSRDPEQTRRLTARSRGCSTRSSSSLVLAAFLASSAGGCSSTRASPRRRTRRSTSPACCCWSSRSRSCRPASTSSGTRRPPAAAAPRPA